MNDKTIVLIDDVRADKEAWLKAHSTRLGASEMAAICGLNRWQTPLDVWLVKTGKRPPQVENMAMKLGTMLEPVVGKLYEEETGRKVIPFNRALSRSDLPWAIVTPDFEVQGEEIALLETKTTVIESDWEGDKTPDYAHIQNLFQCGVAGYERGEIACLVLSNRNFVTRKIPFSEEVFAQLVEKGEAFMKLVKEDTPPSPVSKNDLKALVETGVTKFTDEELVVDIEKNLDLQALAIEHIRWTEIRLSNDRQSKDARERAETIEVDLRRAMGNHRTMKIGNLTLVQKERGRKGFFQNPSNWIEFKISAE